MTIARVRTVMTGVAGSPFWSNMYVSGVSDSTSAQNAVDAVDEFWSDYAINIITGVTGIVEGDVALINEASGEITGVISVTNGSFVGGSGDVPLPPATQGLVRWRTDTFAGGRRIQGRTFLPGTGETVNADGKPVGGYVSGVNVVAAELLTNLQGDGLDLVVWSRKNGIAPVISTGTCWLEWAVLRSRRD